jgi:hypothetical protein
MSKTLKLLVLQAGVEFLGEIFVARLAEQTKHVAHVLSDISPGVVLCVLCVAI